MFSESLTYEGLLELCANMPLFYLQNIVSNANIVPLLFVLDDDAPVVFHEVSQHLISEIKGQFKSLSLNIIVFNGLMPEKAVFLNMLTNV